MSASSKELLACAIAAAHAAGEHAHANPGRRRDAIKTSAHDIKLALDVESQERAEAAIVERFPDDGIMGEENTGGGTVSAPPESGRQWVIDPIDGTVNFSHGMSLWCSSVAVREGDRTLAGAVFAPDLGELYTATFDGPAERNGETLHVSDISALCEAMVCTGLDKNAIPGAAPFAVLNTIATHARKARVLGSAALDICRVAAGQADGYFEAGIYLWDIAAAGLIVERAGGTVEIPHIIDWPRMWFIATNGHIHNELRTLLLKTVSRVQA